MSTVGANDLQIRPKYKNLLDASYKPFKFAQLPLELCLRILSLATAASQGTYRSLLLINKRITELVRSEKMLEGVSVILTKEQQLYAFEAFLAMRPEYVDQIRALWTICPGAVRRVVRVSVSIINTCTNVRSLACYPLVLLESVCRGAVFKHTKCVELTLIEFRVTWSTFMDTSLNGAKFFNQLEHLHFIGAFEYTGWAANWAMIPQFDNLNRISIAMGSYSQIQPTLFNKVVKSPKLKQVVVTTRLHGDEQQALQDAVQQIDHRFSVIHRRRRWKETNLWHEGLHDPNRFWKQATAEKDLPPVPRPTTTT